MNFVITILATAVPVARLLTALPAPPVMTPAAVSGLSVAATHSLAHPARWDNTLHLGSNPSEPSDLLRPNTGGVIDLVGALNAAQHQVDEARPANPFRLRYHPPLLGHAVAVAVEAVMLGATDEQTCCVLNRQALHPGDSFEGLSVERIANDLILLRSARYRLALPVDDRPITLQLPSP